MRTQLVVAARRGHPLRNAKSLAELARASWLIFRAPGQNSILEQAFSAAGLHFPPPFILCESYSIALMLLAKTDTVGLVAPQILAEPWVGASVQEIPLDQPLPPLIQGVFTRADVPLTPVAAAMARALTAAARRLARAS
jgi:LysR family transcriptional regulator of abg operon